MISKYSCPWHIFLSISRFTRVFSSTFIVYVFLISYIHKLLCMKHGITSNLGIYRKGVFMNKCLQNSQRHSFAHWWRETYKKVTYLR